MFLAIMPVNAQVKYYTRIVVEENVRKELKLRGFEDFLSVEDREMAVASLVPLLASKGFIEASIDSTSENGDTLLIYLHAGTKYEVHHTIEGDSLPQPKEKRSQKQSRNGESWSILSEKLDDYANVGYPFARLYNSSMEWHDDSMLVVSVVERGPLVKIDSIVNRGTAKITSGYLQNYLGIKPGQYFNESAIRGSEALLRALPFVTYSRPPKIYFRQNKADIWLYLDKKKLSRFDFLVGILPNNQQTGKVSVTGEAGLQLYNAFGRGEQLKLDWRKLQGSSQQLNVLVNFPYILKTPIGVYATFTLDKRDTSHLNLNWKAGIPYTWKGGNFLRVYVENLQTIVISPDTNYVKATRKLPATLDASSLLYGLETMWSNIDYVYNPTKGIQLYGNFALGNKKLKENNSITNLKLASDPAFDFSSLYDSLGRKSLKGNIEWMVAGYIPVGKRHVFKLATQGKTLLNETLLDNELYRLGGNRLLRGFDEESIRASIYNVATAEYRFLLDRNAFFQVFFDAAYTKTRVGEAFKNDFPFGFGAGVNFETRAGIFGVSYAMGRQLGNPIDFKSAKLHFGYVNIF